MKIIIYLFFIIFSFSLSEATFAHTIKSENEVGALIHIDPVDQPIAKERSVITLQFKDTNEKFKLDDCSCRLIIFLEEKQLFETDLQSISENELLASEIIYVFPEPAKYKIKVTGVPKGQSFKDFELEYEVRANSKTQFPLITSMPKSHTGSWLSAHSIHAAGGILILGFLIFALIKQSSAKRNNNPHGDHRY